MHSSDKRDLFLVPVLVVWVESMMFQCRLGEVVRLLVALPVLCFVPERDGLGLSGNVRRDPLRRGDAADVLQDVCPKIPVFVLEMSKSRMPALLDF